MLGKRAEETWHHRGAHGGWSCAFTVQFIGVSGTHHFSPVMYL